MYSDTFTEGANRGMSPGAPIDARMSIVFRTDRPWSVIRGPNTVSPSFFAAFVSRRS